MSGVKYWNKLSAILVVLLILTSLGAAYYYYEYSTISNENASLISELSTATSAYNSETGRYNQLVSAYNGVVERYNGSVSSFVQLSSAYNQSMEAFSSLTTTYENLAKGYNSTLAYLVQAVSVLNTTEPAYTSATLALQSLWNQYQQANLQFRTSVAEYQNLTHQYQLLASTFYKQNLNSSYPLVQIKQPTYPPLLSFNMLVDFGNGTKIWYNGTSFQPGWNLYQATLVLTGGRMDSTWYPQYGEHYIYGIFGVENTQSDFWFLWSYSSSGWNTTQVGADDIQVTNGTSYAWTFCGMNTQYQPTCTP